MIRNKDIKVRTYLYAHLLAEITRGAAVAVSHADTHFIVIDPTRDGNRPRRHTRDPTRPAKPEYGRAAEGGPADLLHC